MHFSTVVVALAGASTALASAIPGKSSLMDRQAAVTLCTGASSSAVCCATDVLGVADLDCAPPPTPPTSLEDFTNICAAIGQQARCCLLPILEQGLICANPGK
ncbi:hypothetical protein G647_05438 [Cladophialophora carrionii CBS 160.54]|uniref:Cerato-ulmin n=2 Tax=Cladophialophora carrionii TaxID=86049 RepID=A0A1C1CPY1_9EURO|nr:uncharacterized protein G647_05438 [Cladophialophora carrionii CBS 160.54]ETI23636.1 hypothetical protein G647_05438 [Cladophialophora carrionii CBS 160.54]OCT50574.1 Cerato-ulmin [Cladophialophora carrionii]